MLSPQIRAAANMTWRCGSCDREDHPGGRKAKLGFLATGLSGSTGVFGKLHEQETVTGHGGENVAMLVLGHVDGLLDTGI